MRIVLVDHRDSFTGNLYQDLGVLAGCPPTVVACDDPRLAPDRLERTLLGTDLVVLSAGPGHPEHARDVGWSAAVVRCCSGRLPIFGVCFGMQLLVHESGGRVIPAADVVHGKSWQIDHTERGLFAGLPSPVTMMRYHSFVVERASLPEQFEVSAWTPEGEVMALHHRHEPIWAVQFHPESIGSPSGKTLLANLLTEVAGASGIDRGQSERAPG